MYRTLGTRYCLFLSLSRLRRLHPHHVVEAVEVVEEADGGGEFDDFAFVEVLAEIGPHSVVNVVRMQRFAFGESKRGLLGGSEVGAGFEVSEVCDLVVGPA